MKGRFAFVSAFTALLLVAFAVSISGARDGSLVVRGVALSATPTPTPSTLPSATPSAADSPSAAHPSASDPRPERPSPSASPTSAPIQKYTTWVNGAEVHAGLLGLVRKDDDLFLDLKPGDFGKRFVVMPAIASGVGGAAFAGRAFVPLELTFKRVGKRVLWIAPNSHYVASAGSAQAASLAISVADTVIASTPIVAQDESEAHVVVSGSFFLTDFEGLASDLGKAAPAPSLPGLFILSARPSFALDTTKSYFTAVKTFEHNDEIAATLTFNGPPQAFASVPDGRGIPIGVHYSIVAPSHTESYVPRLADDRVGYFVSAHKRFDDTYRASPFERYIDRWNLANGPIIFTLTEEIPPAYRQTVRNAILEWNTAFAAIGFPDAIEVHDPPQDGTFDPDDARYNPVRWLTSEKPNFAGYSPHVADPQTGQILRAQVVLDGEALRAVERGYADRALPLAQPVSLTFGMSPLALGDAVTSLDGCAFAEGSATEAALGMVALMAQPNATPAARDRYVRDWLFSVVLHEVGHTLGLRHNFVGSTAFSYAQLHDPAFTASHGTTGSIMDYTPVNLAAPGERQADYFPLHLGPYDLWAIRYGYSGTEASDAASDAQALAPVLARSSEPELAYGTDEDLVAPYDLDPRIARFDLSSDPLAYDRAQFAIDDALVRKLSHADRNDGRSFADLRQTLVTILNNQLQVSALVGRYVGGVYTSRLHRDQPGAGAPLRAIPRAQQRRAFDLLERYVFAADAFAYPPELLNNVIPERFGLHWNSSDIRRLDFPIREVVVQIQDDVLTRLFSPANVARIADEELAAGRPGETMRLADLFAWTNAAVFGDLDGRPIPPFHRDLQRRFLDLQTQMLFVPVAAIEPLGVPRDLQALARHALVELRSKLRGIASRTVDPATRAHLDDLTNRVSAALDARPLRQL
jgi:Met-zincin/Domain of unknown function (DUF5117)